MIQGQSTTALLQVGETLTINAANGSAQVIPTSFNAEPGTPVAVNAVSQTFGPFDDLRSFRILCVDGFVTTSQTMQSIQFGRPHTASYEAYRTGTVVVPEGSKLTVTGSGTIVQRGTVSPLIAIPAELGPFTETRRYSVTAGPIGASIRTAWFYADPTPPPQVLEPLAIFAASQPVTAAYSLRRLRPDYAGACLQVRDSGNTLRTLSFKADGGYDATGWSAFGDGVSFTVSTWYDQTAGTPHNFTSTVRPQLVFPNAPTNYDGAYIDFTAKTQNMVTATGAEFLSVGGTANLSIFAVAGVYGWTSSGTHPRNPPVYSAAGTNLLGYGTVSGAFVQSAGGQSGETTLYGKEGELLVDASIPDLTRRRVWWWNQKGAVVSGGADTRKLFTDRPHGAATAGPARLVLGNNGALTQSHNGPVREIIIFNNAGALSDLECQRIAIGQTQAWSSIGNARYPDRHVSTFAGQSNANNYGVDAASGSRDGSNNVIAGSNAFTTIYQPALNAALGTASDTAKEVAYLCLTTSFGNSAVVKAAQDNTGSNYWWDSDGGAPGPRLTSWASALQGVPGRQYRKDVIMWSQGEREAYFMANGGADVSADWKAQTKLVWAYMRSVIGYDCPIVIQPLGNQTGCQSQMDALRAVQTQLAAEVLGVTISAETTDLVRQDSVHFAPISQSPNGYQLGATRLALKIGPIMQGMTAR